MSPIVKNPAVFRFGCERRYHAQSARTLQGLVRLFPLFADHREAVFLRPIPKAGIELSPERPIQQLNEQTFFLGILRFRLLCRFKSFNRSWLANPFPCLRRK